MNNLTDHLNNPSTPHIHISSQEGLLSRHSITTSQTVCDALKAINALSGEAMTLFVLDNNDRLVGTVTDGDIRRALISGAKLEDQVNKIMHTNYLAINPGDDLWIKMAEGRKRRIALIPVVENSRIVNIIDLHKVKTMLPIDVVLMAGGRGERLRPLTDSIPKPLLPVGGKAIIDYNIDELERCGINKIYVTVNYLADQIENHFAHRKGRAEVECVREPRKLGTMGSLAYVEGMRNDDVLLMNSDLLTNINFETFYLHHRQSGAGITIGAVPYTVSVPFAIMHMQHGKVKGLEEKPTYNYFANGGVYLIKRSLLSRIVKGDYLDAPDFISSYIADGGEVGCFPIEGTWIDIGSPDDYRYANELMSRK